MSNARIENHPVLGSAEKGDKVTIYFDEKPYDAYESESIAAVLLANGIRTLRYHEESGNPRGIYCNIGHCFECRVTVDGRQGQRACLTPVRNGMKIESGRRLATPFKEGEYND